MKRSSKLALVSVAGIAAVVAYSWYGNNADAETESNIYTSVADCVSSGQDEAICKARFGEAMDTYAKTTPRFVSKEDCEKDFGAGACTAAPQTADAPAAGATTGSSTSYFMPMMMGYMVARMMQGGQAGPAAPAAPLYGCASGAAAGSSCYSTNSGRSYYAYSNGGARTVRTPVSEFRSSSARGGFSVIPRGGSAVKSAIASRGGFGSSGRGFSSGG